MAKDLPASKIIEFIVGDFEAAWDALASLPGPLPRGNFLFARQATTLLEVACRLCAADPHDEALARFSDCLCSRDARYFLELPGICWAPSARTREAFTLPHQGADPTCHLLAALFNLIRNGQAHQYQQMRARLTDGKDLCFTVTGPRHQLFLASVLAHGRPADHLSGRVDDSGDTWITLRTDVFFLDLRDSIRESRLLERDLRLKYLVESHDRTFNFDTPNLHTALERGGSFRASG